MISKQICIVFLAIFAYTFAAPLNPELSGNEESSFKETLTDVKDFFHQLMANFISKDDLCKIMNCSMYNNLLNQEKNLINFILATT